jgi:hypothetical protein
MLFDNFFHVAGPHRTAAMLFAILFACASIVLGGVLGGHGADRGRSSLTPPSR